MIRRSILILAVIAGVGAACATPYSVVWDGNDWPENQGWTHTAYNYYGGALGTRELSNGEMHLDGTASAGIVDFQSMYHPGLDPGQNEEFIMSWSVRIDAVLVYPWDVGVTVLSDDARMFTARFGIDNLRLPFESNHIIPFVPYVYHDYMFRSYNMREYALWIDGALEWEGQLVQSVDGSYVAWGDGTEGAASASSWQSYTFGVIPEPGCVLLGSVLVTLVRGRPLGAWRSLT